MTSGACEKGFPKKCTEHTVLADSSYPVYRRRSKQMGGQTHMIKIKKHANTHEMYEVDNSWVVPYNPLLSLKYDSHINVEIVHSVTSVKYLYKYLMKGNDRVIVRLANGQERDITNDEIQRFQDARYISPSEAYWRIF